MNEIEIGERLPEFKLQNEKGEWVTSSALIGHPVVIYFYPKDDTPGCTTQACGFRDDWDSFEELDAKVFGVSADSVASHMDFAQKFHLPFSLLSDPDNVLRGMFGVKGDLFGLIPGRATYVFDREAKLIHKFRSQSKAKQHVEEARKALRSSR